jgi:TonB family protein
VPWLAWMEKTGASVSANHIGVGAGTATGAHGSAGTERPVTGLLRLKLLRATAMVFVVAVSLTWLFSLLKTRLPSLLVPWFVVFWLGFVWGVKSIFDGEDEYQSVAWIARFREPNPLKNWLAISYLSGSLLFFGLLARVPFESFQKAITTRQVVDIQLVSASDYLDHHDVLPSTEPKPSQRKRSGDPDDVVDPSNRSFKPVRKSSKPIQDHPRESVPAAQTDNIQAPIKKIVRKSPADRTTFFIAQEKPEEPMRSPQFVPKNFPWRQYSSTTVQMKETQQFGAHVTNVSTPKIAYANVPMEVEEVHPPQLLEVTDNDGEIGMETWQAGGRSNGGKGAPSSLSTYLKEMHKKLKKTWSPPSGTSRHAQVRFRLSRDGATVSVKLIASSGDANVDQSALQAIAAAAPFGNLPKDYLADYLDVLYTFNYRADELTEVTTR